MFNYTFLCYFSLKNEEFAEAQKISKASSLKGEMAGVFIALNDNENKDYFLPYTKDKDEDYAINTMRNKIEEWKKITFSENDIIAKLNMYIERKFVDTKLDKWDKKDEIDSIIEFNMDSASQFGIRGTPSFVINGEVVVGELNLQNLTKKLTK